MSSLFATLIDEIDGLQEYHLFGRVTAILGLMVEVGGVERRLSIGGRCLVRARDGRPVPCEVVGFRQGRALLMPLGTLDGVGLGCKAEVASAQPAIHPAADWLGRVVNALGQPVDGKGPAAAGQAAGAAAQPAAAGAQAPPRRRQDRTGGQGAQHLRELLPRPAHGDLRRLRGRQVGADVDDRALYQRRGQRHRADRRARPRGPGVPRGRSRAGGPGAQRRDRRHLGRTAADAAPGGLYDAGDRRALPRRRPARALHDGQHHPLRHGPARDRPVGRRAADQQGLSADHLRRAATVAGARGSGAGEGAITALFTALVEGDDHNEPIADAVRGILDGHIVLERAIGERGRYPAVNVLRSVSRTMPNCNAPEENAMVQRARLLLSTYENMAEMIRLGAYRKGSDPAVDEAIHYYPEIEAFLAQDKRERTRLTEGYDRLAAILDMAPPSAAG